MRDYIFRFMLLSVVLLIIGCGRKNIQDYGGHVVVKQHCGFDNLEGGHYVLKNPQTGELIDVSVDIRWCDIYSEKDTIK